MQGPYSFLSPMAFGTAYLLIFLIHAYNYTTHLYQPSLWLTKYRERIFPLSNREILGEERLSIPTEMKQRASTLPHTELCLAIEEENVSDQPDSVEMTLQDSWKPLSPTRAVYYFDIGGWIIVVLEHHLLAVFEVLFHLPVKEDPIFNTSSLGPLELAEPLAMTYSVISILCMRRQTGATVPLPKNVTVSEEQP